MRTLGVPLIRRWMNVGGGSMGALGTADARKDWWKDAPTVIPITVCALPILAPTAIGVMLTLLVWYGLEIVGWLPLWFVARVRKRRNRPTKRVNWPELSLKL
ncbi:MAG: hypothetical protein ACRD1V_08085 [Vicinamibacterales bacterium]